MSDIETYDRDDPPEVEAARVFMRMDPDGEPVYFARRCGLAEPVSR